MIASGGDPNPPVWSRAFWASLEGIIAAVLLVAGGLAALQTMAILVALPFSIVMVLIVIATIKALNAEQRAFKRRRRQEQTDLIVGAGHRKHQRARDSARRSLTKNPHQRTRAGHPRG